MAPSKNNLMGDQQPDGAIPSDGSGNGMLQWLLRSGPTWARIPAAIAAIGIALSPPLVAGYHYFFPAEKQEAVIIAKGSDASQLDMGSNAQLASDEMDVQTTLNSPNPTPEEKQKARESFKRLYHQQMHLQDIKDQVPWTVFARKSPKDYFGYKVFPSDKCLLITRVENNQSSSEWLTDPNHPIDRPSPIPTHSQTPATAAPTHVHLPTQSSMPHLEPAIYLESEPRIHLNLDDHEERRGSVSGLSILGAAIMSSTQGMCLNPHPGNFTFQWGMPINQCQTPIYRQFADGCTHTQIYDHCVNAWGPVVWQSCAINHF